MTFEKTWRPCARPGCPRKFRRNVSRGHPGPPQRYCGKKCVGLAERDREKASPTPRRRRENKRRFAEEIWTFD